jgi:hypothetical protein
MLFFSISMSTKLVFESFMTTSPGHASSVFCVCEHETQKYHDGMTDATKGNLPEFLHLQNLYIIKINSKEKILSIILG